MTKTAFLLTGIFALTSLGAHAEPQIINNAVGTNLAPQQKVFNERPGLEKELEQLIELYSTQSREKQIKAINKRIRFSGITDPRLFDIVENNLLNSYKITKKRIDKQYSAWLAQMLAFSGQDKYIPTLQKVRSESSSSSVVRHTSRSLEVLPQYKKWNQVISQNLEGLRINQLPRARVKNMLNAEDPELIRGGASIVHHFYLGDLEITDIAHQRLLDISPKATSRSTDQYAEASAWLCKILGGSRNSKYADTLAKVGSTTQSPAIKRWANKAARML